MTSHEEAQEEKAVWDIAAWVPPEGWKPPPMPKPLLGDADAHAEPDEAPDAGDVQERGAEEAEGEARGGNEAEGDEDIIETMVSS